MKYAKLIAIGAIGTLAALWLLNHVGSINKFVSATPKA